MKRVVITPKDSQKTWISLTGYRVLLILKSLMQEGCTVNELVEILKNNSITNKSISKDTVRVALNTLKNAGCKICRPSKANGYKYELISHPFCLNLSDVELKILIHLRDKISYEMEWNDVLILNELYKKIISLTFKNEQINEVDNTKPLFNVDKNVLLEISSSNLLGKKIQITYDSPEFGEENIDIVPQKITYENGKLYLWCYSFKYKKNSLLNLERIVKVNSVDISKEWETSFVYDVIYTVTGNSMKVFEKKEFEEIIEKTDNHIKVLAHVENEFYFIQRLLLFGVDFQINSPNSFKEKLINKIKLIKKGYEQ